MWADFHPSIIFMPTYVILPFALLFWVVEFYLVTKAKQIVLGNSKLLVSYTKYDFVVATHFLILWQVLWVGKIHVKLQPLPQRRPKVIS